MPKPIAAAFFILLAGQGFAGAADAQSVANRIAELGLLGRWARDCALPLQSGNPHIYFEVSGGGVRYRFVFSPTSQTVRSVDGVEVQPDGTILMRVTNISGDEPGFRMELRMAKEAGRYRVMHAKGSDGKVYVENGVIVATGRENYWQRYCGPN